MVAAGMAKEAPAEMNSGVTLKAGPRWGEVPPGSWTPYSVTARNDGGADIDGEMVLVPQPEPPPKPGVPPSSTTTTSPVNTTVLAIGSRALVPSPLQGRGASTEPPPWPTYTEPLNLPAGTEKTLTVMVLEAPFGYRVEMRAHDGRTIAGAPGPVPSGRERTAVLLLSEVNGAEATIEALPQQVVPGLDVIQPSTVRDFPRAALQLAGLDAVVIDNFDTATLAAGQRQALRDYVSLGGTLVVAGGAAGSRILGSLPKELAPLRPSGSAAVSLDPLAALAARSTTATATMVTGNVGAGRVVLGASGGPPLVVESDYGSGRVIQLAYDPLAEPLRSDQALRGPAWDQALGRLSHWGVFVSGALPAPIAADQLWRLSLEDRKWPSWPQSGVGLLVLYALFVGLAAVVLFRRRRSAGTWVVLPAIAALAAGACTFATGGGTSETVVEVQRSGADGTALTSTYRGVFTIRGSDMLRSSPGAALSTVFSDQPVFRSVADQLDPLTQPGPLPPVARGTGGGAVHPGGVRPDAQHPTRRWELRTVQALSVDHAGPSLDAPLRLVGTSQSSRGRLIGKVTNRGRTPIYQLRAQIIEGQARLADALLPGETRAVDAPVIGVRSTAPDPSLVPQPPDEVAMFAAAGRAFTVPGQVVLVGLTTRPRTGATTTTNGGHRVGIAVSTAPLLAADSVVANSGGARLVSSSLAAGGGRVSALDLAVPPGVGPLSVRYPAALVLPGQPPPTLTSVEAYNWTTSGWRTLPPTGERPNYSYV